MRQTERLAKACDPKSLTAGQLMEDAVLTCGPRTDGLAIARLMTGRKIGSLPVVDEERTLVGLITEHDLLQATIEGRDLRKVTAAELMARKVLTVTEDMSLEQLANLFQDRYLTRAPVVRGGKLVGIVARRDLLFGYLKALQYWS
jgi:CBS domain-containing protein